MVGIVPYQPSSTRVLIMAQVAGFPFGVPLKAETNVPHVAVACGKKRFFSWLGGRETQHFPRVRFEHLSELHGNGPPGLFSDPCAS